MGTCDQGRALEEENAALRAEVDHLRRLALGAADALRAGVGQAPVEGQHGGPVPGAERGVGGDRILNGHN